MGLSFRKSIKVGKNTRINLSKTGGSGISTGVKGARISVNKRGVRTQVGAKGIYYRKDYGFKNSNSNDGIEIVENNVIGSNVIGTNNNNDLVIRSSKKSAICLLLGLLLTVIGFALPFLLFIAAPLLIYALVNKEQRFALKLQRSVMAYRQGNYNKSYKLLEKAKSMKETEQTELLDKLLRDVL